MAMIAAMPDELLDLVAGKFQMLADTTRLAILRSLMGGEKSVGQVVTETGRGQANVSKHLKLLAESGLVGRRKEGLQVFYRLQDPLVEKLCELVCSTIREDMERSISRRSELLRKLGPSR
ncbi:HTH-type transcriptional regulator KmtR [Aquisphaera giovannonii]|uniref:HTH-type transcriptional regulator KmtR n=1 Tax=Aquisphaera giovannonii TaxID=406548 RepID=A0A5B9W1R0_9BACT|nr:metalloregulator ArsR/SmtB family transcription factor [Aquisphaera giovannonii]QEH34458.1 HTH-type transcriptional regulator KmtR [Aquisphaera giovannonii]